MKVNNFPISTRKKKKGKKSRYGCASKLMIWFLKRNKILFINVQTFHMYRYWSENNTPNPIESLDYATALAPSLQAGFHIEANKSHDTQIHTSVLATYTLRVTGLISITPGYYFITLFGGVVIGCSLGGLLIGNRDHYFVLCIPYKILSFLNIKIM